MRDELKDPDLEWVRALWDAPPPSEGFHQKVLTAYRRQNRNLVSRSLIWILPFAALAASLVLGVYLAPSLKRVRPSTITTGPGAIHEKYRPVKQPHFIVISQGEHP